MTLTNQRKQGILKRFRGTPLAPWAYMVATVASCVIRTLVLVALTLGVGVAFYGLSVPAHSYGASWSSSCSARQRSARSGSRSP